jgi:DNA-binding NarL/FixJ family response regulator
MMGAPGPSGSAPRTVLLVDDQPEFLQLAKLLLDQHPALQVVGEAHSGESALAILSQVQPDAAIVDVHMPGMNGFEAARQLLRQAPELRVILVSAFDDAQFAVLARQSGAVAFLTKKSFSPEAIAQVLEHAA